MAHTNVYIPKSMDTQDRRAWNALKAECEFWQKEAEHLARELQNIPAAIERHGYVTIEDGRDTIRLVKERSDDGEQSEGEAGDGAAEGRDPAK